MRRMLTTIAVAAVSMVAPGTVLADPGQTVTDSTGTVQAGVPGLTEDTTAGAPTSANADEGAASGDPEATLSVGTTPAAGGDQTADSSTGTIQAGGSGGQTADSSTGTVQAGQPGLTADGNAEAPTSANPDDGASGDPEATLSLGTTQAAGGDQTAENSTGTIQAGGGGGQTTDSSTGTVQAPGAGQAADASAGPTESPQQEGTAPASESSQAPAGATAESGGVLGGEHTQQAKPDDTCLTVAPAAAGIPFTGLPTWLVLLVGAAAFASGSALRRRCLPTPTA